MMLIHHEGALRRGAAITPMRLRGGQGELKYRTASSFASAHSGPMGVMIDGNRQPHPVPLGFVV